MPPRCRFHVTPNHAGSCSSHRTDPALMEELVLRAPTLVKYLRQSFPHQRKVMSCSRLPILCPNVLRIPDLELPVWCLASSHFAVGSPPFRRCFSDTFRCARSVAPTVRSEARALPSQA